MQPYPPAEFFGDPETIVVIDNENNVLPVEADVGTLGDAEAARRKAYSQADNCEYWHTDYSFNRYIPSVGLMRAEVIPDYGGDTVWANNYAAYEGLSPTMRRIVGDLDAVHWTGPLFPERFGLDRFGPDAEDRFNQKSPPWPIPWSSPTPRPNAWLCFVNPQYVTHVVGLSRAESTMLLQFLLRHITSPTYLFPHHLDPRRSSRLGRTSHRPRTPPPTSSPPAGATPGWGLAPSAPADERAHRPITVRPLTAQTGARSPVPCDRLGERCGTGLRMLRWTMSECRMRENCTHR